MTSRERILSAINHAVPDRTPCDYHGMAACNNALFTHFNLAPGDYPALMDRLGYDMIDIRGVVDPVWHGPFPQIRELGGGEFQTWLGFRMRRMQTSFGEITEHSDSIWKNARDIAGMADGDTFTFPKVEWFDFSGMSARLDRFKGRAIMASGASVFQHPSFLRGLDNYLCDLYEAPEIVAHISRLYTDFYLAYFDRMLTACEGKIDILRCADDFGTQQALLINRDLLRRFFYPALKKLIDLAHSHGAKFMFHSCGSIRPIIGDLIELGVDILDPLQPRANDMDLASLKAEFGGRICFHGSVCTQETLPHGTPDDVRRDVRARLELYAGQGGFILAPAHIVQPDVPLENLLALYEETRCRCQHAKGPGMPIS
jgi:uroporphyrinogen decarboxylase